MKLASRANGRPDGELLVVSGDLQRAVPARAAATLQEALDRWSDVEASLRREYEELESGRARDSIAIEPAGLLAAMPRSYQFLDASAFLAHNHILARAWGFEPRTPADPPLMYQGLSDHFLPAHRSVRFRSVEDEIDFEAEFAVITDRVPLGTTRRHALAHVKLLVMLNDWSLRAFGPAEMKAGFGFLHAKPPSTLSAFAVTPDELASAWCDARVDLTMRVVRNDQEFGRPRGKEMSYGFDDLIAHAAATRDLCAGTVLGSGTVASFEYATVGSACIAERRAIDRIEGREATQYLQFGERVRIEALDARDSSVFGMIDQVIAQYGSEQARSDARGSLPSV